MDIGLGMVVQRKYQKRWDHWKKGVLSMALLYVLIWLERKALIREKLPSLCKVQHLSCRYDAPGQGQLLHRWLYEILLDHTLPIEESAEYLYGGQRPEYHKEVLTYVYCLPYQRGSYAPRRYKHQEVLPDYC